MADHTEMREEYEAEGRVLITSNGYSTFSSDK